MQQVVSYKKEHKMLLMSKNKDRGFILWTGCVGLGWKGVRRTESEANYT